MSLARELFDSVKESLSNAPAQVGAELRQQAAHGAHELAAALFNGQGFVMYPRGGKDDPMSAPEQSQDHAQPPAPGMDEPTHHLEHGGRGGR